VLLCSECVTELLFANLLKTQNTDEEKTVTNDQICKVWIENFQLKLRYLLLVCACSFVICSKTVANIETWVENFRLKIRLLGMVSTDNLYIDQIIPKHARTRYWYPFVYSKNSGVTLGGTGEIDFSVTIESNLILQSLNRHKSNIRKYSRWTHSFQALIAAWRPKH